MPVPPVPPVPYVPYSGDEAKKQLVVVIERMLYMLDWVAENPTAVLDGRHHDAFHHAITELRQLLAPKVPAQSDPVWKQYVNAIPKEGLATVGLTDAQLALKLGVFNQLFDEFLDMAAKRGSKDRQLFAEDIEKFRRKVLPWYRRLRPGAVASRALGVGNTILSSIIALAPSIVELVPGGHTCLEAIKEVTEFVHHAVEAFESKG